VETLTYSSGRASGCDSPGLLNYGATCQASIAYGPKTRSAMRGRPSQVFAARDNGLTRCRESWIHSGSS
jgi:hypothetical protein